VRRPEVPARRLGPWVALAAILGVGVSVATAAQGRWVPKRTQTLWFFFAPGQKGLASEARRIGDYLRVHPELDFRPCLLLDDGEPIRRPSRDLAETIRILQALQGPGFALPLWDGEGAAFARELGIERLPAYALVDARAKKAHVATGQGARFEDLLPCR